MWYRQLLVLPLIVALVWVLTGAWAQQTPPAKTAAPAPTPPPKVDPETVKSLNLAIERFGAKREGWLKTTVWQQVSVQGLTYQADGMYLAGPGHRLRLELKVRVGGTDGEQQVISDGTSVWQVLRVGGEKPHVTKFALAEILSVVNAPGAAAAQLQNEFFQSLAFLGVAPLLRSLQQTMVFTKQEAGEWKGNKVQILTGVWSADIAKTLGTSDRWVPGIPRKCVLYLDAKTSWPYRLEWWGPASPRMEDELLMQLEFRDPTLLKPGDPPPAEYLALCKFDEKDVQVNNQTKQLTEALRERSKQMSAKTPAPVKK